MLDLLWKIRKSETAIFASNQVYNYGGLDYSVLNFSVTELDGN